MPIICLPASFGMKLIANDSSGPTPISKGSSSPLGRVRVPVNNLRSLGKSNSGMSKLAAHSEPTEGIVGSSITIIENGL